MKRPSHIGSRFSRQRCGSGPRGMFPRQLKRQSTAGAHVRLPYPCARPWEPRNAAADRQSTDSALRAAREILWSVTKPRDSRFLHPTTVSPHHLPAGS
ncbi:hypothetical protein MRX96_054479 [Rhipicephalus microplus]